MLTRLGALVARAWLSSLWVLSATSVRAETVRVPTGPASLRGLGAAFDASPATGTGSFSVPLELPPGFLMPGLSLEYASGSGRDVLGLSFELPVTSIYRTTDRGAPNFDEEDRFAVDGDLRGELLRVSKSLGYYRLRDEAANVLFVRRPETDSWEIRHPGGVSELLGVEQMSRQESSGRSFRWYVSSQQDVFGHKTRYRYGRDQGRIYLEAIDYQTHATVDKQNHVLFAYEGRPDAYVDYSSGDQVVTARRLREVKVLHGERVVRSYGFKYDDTSLFGLLQSVRCEGEHGLASPPLTFDYYSFERNTEGKRRMFHAPPLDGLSNGTAIFEDVNRDGLDDLLVGLPGNWYYYENLDGQSWSSTPTKLFGSPDRGLNELSVVLADMDGDGDRDVVESFDQAFRYYPAREVTQGVFPGFGGPIRLASQEGEFPLRDGSVRLSDLNGDGRIDVLMQKPGSDLWLVNRDNWLKSVRVPELPQDVYLDEPGLEFVDFNGDGNEDAVRIDMDFGQRRIRVWYGYGQGRFTRSYEIGNIPRGAREEFSLQDLNNDGQVDLVRTSGSWATYYLNDGRGAFTQAQAHYDGLPGEVETAERLFADLNGNGTTDLVWVTRSGQLFTLDLVGQPFSGLLRSVDNGMGGRTEVTYRSSTDFQIDDKLKGRRWRTSLPTPIPVVAAIEVSDSMGQLGLSDQRSRLEYRYSDGYYDGKRRVFRAFGEVDTIERGDAQHLGLLKRSLFHVGRDLRNGEEQIGLAGLPYAELEYEASGGGQVGKLYQTREILWELRDLCRNSGTEREFFPECDSVDADARLRVPLLVETLAGSFEGTAEPRYSGERSIYNAWGDLVAVESYGEVTLKEAHAPGDRFSLSRADLSVGGDEVYAESDLIYDLQGWNVGIPYAMRRRSSQGSVLSETRSFFDGQAFVGLSLGRIDRGLVTRSQAWLAEEARWIDTERFAYNRDGQRIIGIDATGVRREVDYDTDTGLFAVTQRTRLGGQPAESHTEYDTAYGHVVRSVDPNGQAYSARYDGLGRIREVVDPLGDVVSTYEYDEARSTRPFSIVSVGALRARGQSHYDMSYVYVDALGRTRQVKEEADELGYVASGWVELSARGAVVRAYEPFATETLGLEPAPRATPFGLTHYDGLGRPLRTELPATEEQSEGSDLFTAYLPFQVQSFSERASNDSRAAYPVETLFDGLGRAVKQARYNVDERNNVQKLIWSQEYDGLDRVVRFRDPAWHAGAPKSGERARHERTYEYDSLGRLTQLYDANLGRLEYTYDDSGRPLTRTDEAGQLRSVEYDYESGGRPTAQYFQTGGNIGTDEAYYFHYDRPDPSGPLADASGLVGRLAWVEHPTGARHFSYDALGLPERLATTLWDPGRSSFVDQARDKFVRSVVYDPQGVPERVGLPGGLETELKYGTRGLLRSVRGGFGGDLRVVFDRAQYDGLGALVALEQGNQTRSCHTRDARGRRTRLLTGPARSTDCSSFESPQAFRHLGYRYTYDNLLDGIMDLSQAKPSVPRLDQRFRYDWLEQLTHVDTARGSYDYAYDHTQNLVSQSGSAGAKGARLGFFRYGENTDGPNRITSYCEDAACLNSEEFAYDALGRLVRYHGYDLAYDAQNRLVRAHKEHASQVDYYYDDAGRRVLAIHKPDGKSARVIRVPFDGYEERNGERIWKIPGPEGEAEIVRSKGLMVDLLLLDQLTQYVATGGRGPKPLPEEYSDLDDDGDGFDRDDLARARDAYEQELRVGGEREVWRWIHPDHLGSASHISDSAGDMIHAAIFHPYGQESERVGMAGVDGYAGGEREADPDLGLHRFGARYYAPDLGRWLTPDEWIGEAPARMWERVMESGLYGYVGNNPANFRDPSGWARQNKTKTRADRYQPYTTHRHRSKAQTRFGTSGLTHQSEHTIGYAVLSGGHLPRGRSPAARNLENDALAYQEVLGFHRDHIGTGTRATADASGFNSSTYREAQRSLLEVGQAAAAVQLNQLGYAHQHGFQGSSRGLTIADRSFNEMAAHGAQVDYAGQAGIVTRVQLTPSDRAQMLLARHAARTGQWPVALARMSIREILEHFGSGLQP